MGFTRQHANENRKMADFSKRLINSGVVDLSSLFNALAAEFPHVPPHRVKRAAAKAIRQRRYREMKQSKAK